MRVELEQNHLLDFVLSEGGVRCDWAETEYPLAGLPISLVHGDYSLQTLGDVGEKQLYYSQSRDGI